VILLSLIGKLVRDVRILIVGAQNSISRRRRVTWLQCVNFLVVLDRLVIIRIVLAKLRDPKVECYNFCAAFPGSNLDKIVHKESRLNERECLAEANSSELCDDDGGDAWILAVVAIDAVAHHRPRIATRHSLTLRLCCLYHLLMLY
jgi:hypothetical protein